MAAGGGVLGGTNPETAALAPLGPDMNERVRVTSKINAEGPNHIEVRQSHSRPSLNPSVEKQLTLTLNAYGNSNRSALSHLSSPYAIQWRDTGLWCSCSEGTTKPGHPVSGRGVGVCDAEAGPSPWNPNTVKTSSVKGCEAGGGPMEPIFCSLHSAPVTSSGLLGGKSGPIKFLFLLSCWSYGATWRLVLITRDQGSGKTVEV
ncbi:unnamed protein product [Pleuronectes platessa]|uniref:Uncharacterized protein n=1 Tax=Pleuronectes platessa TaxID=8262 RepID=A0A9N7U7X0_PLEPL|nr:unnamed protein product [Pleuronectes platessa]